MGVRPADDDSSRLFSAALADLAERWERGEAASAEAYLSAGRGWSAERALELIYREYRLAKAAGLSPSKSAYLARFPEHGRDLERLLDVDDACPDSFVDRLGADDDYDPLPRAGDAIGPYVLERELGRGGLARVFLARQADLEDRPVVVKITIRPTREPWLLARARHPNIVEILTHAEVDDGELQLIAMPFLGGAALSEILARRRGRPADGGRRPGPRRAGRRFLDDLDAAAAPEHRASGAPAPAREILREMTDARAFAWIAARLAEALDHAGRKGVAHGDVKPSNILIAADGTPMLLDFNLAQDWSRAGAVDAGGTLAYMAPERLRALSGEADAADVAGDDGAHRADVYSLGMVLLEALTGWSPAGDAVADRRGGRAAIADVARSAAATRRRPDLLVRRAEAADGRPLPAGLRSVLICCLQPDPSARHARGMELAEDLDRWRSDRPLAFAPEPSPLYVALRGARRRRRPLAAAALGLAVAALAAALVAGGGRALDAAMHEHAAHKLDHFYDDPGSRIFLPHRPGEPPPRRNPAEAAAAALRGLREYEVSEEADWRARDDFRGLPDAEREDLGLWLLEQALRYGRALAGRDDSPADWRRARTTLDRACRGTWPSPLLDLRERLGRRIGDGDRRPRDSSPAPAWVEAYLRGVSAEIDDEEYGGDSVAGARRASAYYQDVLALRPNSLWGRYRAAVVASALSRWAEAADNVEACLRLRPENAVLRGMLAGCLTYLDRDDDALEQADRAIATAPDHPEFVQIRMFVRADDPELSPLKQDIRRYETLMGLLPPRFLQDASAVAGDATTTARDLPLSRRGGGPIHLAATEIGGIAGELDSRAVLSSQILLTGASPAQPFQVALQEPARLALVAKEVEKILALDPTNLVARVNGMCLSILRDRPREAQADLEGVMADPRLAEYARFAPERLGALHYACAAFAVKRQYPQALRLARKTMELTTEIGAPRGRAFYTLAAVEAACGNHKRQWIPTAAKHLDAAIRSNPMYERWFREDDLFAPVRIQVQAALDALRPGSSGLGPPGRDRLLAEAP